MGKLTAIAIKQLKPRDKPQKAPDGGGLYLLVTTAGAKYWRYDYRYAGKRRTLALGVYPASPSLLPASGIRTLATSWSEVLIPPKSGRWRS